MINDLILKIYIGLNALNDQLSQGASHLGNGLLPILSMYDQLKQHGIIIGRNDIITVNMRIQPHAVSAGQMDIGDLSGTGHKVSGWILCIDPALQRMAGDGDILLLYA